MQRNADSACRWGRACGAVDRKTAAMAGLVGVGLIGVAFAVPWPVEVIGLALVGPREMGGADLGTAGIVIAYAVGVLIAVGSVVGAIVVLRRLGVARPVLVGVAAVVSTVGVLQVLSLATGDIEGAARWVLAAAWLLAGFAAFAAAARFAHRPRVLLALTAVVVVMGASASVAGRLRAGQQAAQAPQNMVEQSRAELASEFGALTTPPQVLDTTQWRITDAEIRDESLLVTQVSIRDPSVVVQISAYRDGADNAPADEVCEPGDVPPGQDCTVNGDEIIRRDTSSSRIVDFALIRAGYRVGITPQPPHQDLDPRSLVGLVRPPTPQERDRLRTLAIDHG